MNASPVPALPELTVLEICSPEAPEHLRLASAMAGRLLADQGIRVVRLPPPDGDSLEQAAPLLPDGTSAIAAFLGLGKSELVPSGSATRADIVAQLLQSGLAGVLIEETEPLRDQIAAAGIPVVEIGTWPAQCPDLGSAAETSEFTVLAASGMLDIIGDPAREPLRLGGHQVAYAAGLSAFTASMTAIYRMGFTGRASHARVSLLETAIWLNWKAVAGPYAGQEVPTREGDGADFQVLPCVDGWIAFVYLPGEFDSVRRMVGDPALDDPRFATVASRRANIRAIIEIVRPWLAERTRAEINAHAQACGVPIGPVFSPRELLEDDQYVHGKFITEVAGTAGGSAFRTPGSPATVNGQRLPLAPRTRVTLEDVLGERA